MGIFESINAETAGIIVAGIVLLTVFYHCFDEIKYIVKNNKLIKH